MINKIKTQIQTLIDNANAKTGKTDSDLTSAVTSLIEGYGSEGTEVPNGLVYSLDEPVTLNGVSDYIDTEVKLYDYDKDFEILIEFEEIENSYYSRTILHCMYESTSYQGLTIKHDGKKPWVLDAIGTSSIHTTFETNGVTRFAIVKIGDYFTIKDMHDDLTEPQLIAEGAIGYKEYSGNLLLGAYQTIGGEKGRFWNGTINKCKVYVGDLPSDEETNAFLMGE